jgi:hypothetical protein
MIVRGAYASALLTSLALCSACRIGDPLVDRLSPRQGGTIPAASCQVPQPCGEIPALALVFSEPKALKWQGCPLKCEGSSSEPPTSNAPLSLDCIPVEPLHELDADLSCVTKRFTASATAPVLAAGADVIADHFRWKTSNVVIEAEVPIEIAISDAELSDTRVDLLGPITLRFEEGTKLSSVTISSTSESARVVFDRVDPYGLIVGDAAQPFAGHMEARHSSMNGASAVVESMELDSVMIEEGFISARDLVSNDGALEGVTLDVGRATFAPTTLLGVAIAKCDTLSFFASKLENVLVPRCSGEPTRIYATNVRGGQIDGRISGDTSGFEGVQLGVSDPTELELWGVKVAASTFCDHIDGVKVSYNAVTCSDCSDDAFDATRKGCLLPLGDFDDLASAEAEEADAGLKSNFCGALDMFEPCRPPLPMRTRPIGELK